MADTWRRRGGDRPRDLSTTIFPYSFCDVCC